MPESSISIRKAIPEDAAIIADFNCAMAMETENKQLDQSTVEKGAKGMIKNSDRGFYLIAEKDHEVQACLMVTFEWSDWRNANFWWIQSVYVAPQARRQGLFNRLYQTVKTLSLEDSVCGIRLYVESENNNAQKTYRALGMSQCDYLMYEESF